MARPGDWWVLDIDGDPTPGAPDNLVTVGDRFLSFADEAYRAQRAVDSLQGDGAVLTWIGQSGDAFREQFGEFPEQLRKLHTSHRMVGDALHAFAPKLQNAQAMADRALADGRAAREQLGGLTGQLQLAQGDVETVARQAESLQQHTDPDPEQVKRALRDAETAQQRLSDVQGRAASAEQALNAAKSLAEQARQLRDGAARECKREISEASDAGIQPRSFWQKLGDALKKLWEVLCEVAKWVALVAGIIAMIIGGPLAWVAVAAGAVLLVKAIVDFAQGKGSILDLVFGVLGIIPGVRGLTSISRLSALYKAGGLREIAKAALTSMRNTVRGLANTVANAARGTLDVVKSGLTRLTNKINELPLRTSKRTLEMPACGDPVDISTGRVFLTETDLELPGDPPLLLERTHRSDYRAGRSFGASWASTLDQRIAVEPGGVHLLAADGTLLTYPVPGAEGAVLPRHGRGLPLRRAGAGFLVTDPAAGLTLLFAAPHADDPRSAEPDAGGPALPAELLPGPAGAAPVAFAPLVAIVDREGNRIEILRDDQGMPREVRHGDGRRVTVTTESGLVTALHLIPADGGSPTPLRTFGYADGRLVQVVNTSGLPVHFAYDDDGRLIRWQDRNGRWYRYTYDEQGRCVLGEGRDGYFSYKFAYEPEQRRTHATNSLGHTTIFDLNEDLQVVAETDPLGGTTYREWDPQHRLLSRTDPLGRTTRFLYDADGVLDTVVRPDGSPCEITYEEGRVTAVSVEQDGRVWRRPYEPAESPDPFTDPLGVDLLLGHRELAGGHAYDPGPASQDDDDEPAYGNEPAAAAPAVPSPMPVGGRDPQVAVLAADPLGRPAVVDDTAGRQVSCGWTVDGEPAWREDPASGRQEWQYDAEGNEVAHTDARGLTTRTEYGPFDLPVATVTPSGARTTYEHDTELRLSRVTDPAGLQWHYRYEAAGRLVGETDFDGRVRRYSYDAAGQLLRIVNAAGETTEFEYDLLGNLVRRRAISARDERSTTFLHDPVGRLVAATSPDAALTIERDFFGRVTAESVDGRTVSFAYDDPTRTVVRGTPSGAQTRWVFDAAGYPVSLTMAGHSLKFEHDDRGRRRAERLDESVTVAREFDDGDRLTAVRGPEGHRAFGYREDGLLTTVSDSRDGTTTFRLDDEGRVTDVDGPGRRESYRYDLSGEPVETSGDGGAAGDRAYEGTDLTRAGEIAYRYDRAGRLIRRQEPDGRGGLRVWTFVWNADGQLHGVVTPDGSRWRYRYDALGRRVAKQRLADGPADAPLDGPAVAQVQVSWDGPTIVEESDTAGRVTTWQHDLDGLRPLLQLDGAADGVAPDGRLRLMVCDPTGVPTDLIEVDGSVAWRSAAGLWGQERNPSDGTPVRFPGQHADPESGLHYNLHRYYDPRTGRYISPDPLGLGAGPSPVRYVDNPLLEIDPLGLVSCRAAAQKANVKIGNLYKKGTKPAGSSSSAPAGGISKPGKQLNTHVPNKRTMINIRRALGKEPRILTKADFDGPLPQSEILTKLVPGTSTRSTQCWSVEWLNNSSRTGDVEQALLQAGRQDDKWIRGHLINDNLGGHGTTDNLTPLTHMANVSHKNLLEQPIKYALDRFRNLRSNYKIDGDFAVSYKATVSDAPKFPASTDAGERAIRDFVEFDAQYLRDGVPLSPADLGKINDRLLGQGEKPLPALPPPGTRMDPVTGVFTTPTGSVWG
ncbi:RHS repeat-associated core domain-containing protein [Actinoplanes sp. NPDC051475]|uniref:RHS repeat-associated core domain-containing protein n=1 Tax=Actinoplanes sp. NPDC051475 TaxID=3157225 RepID=UPI0034507929